MRIDHPAAGQIPALRALWKEAFGDTDAFLDAFFNTAYSPRRCRCVMENGTVAAALYWFDWHFQGKKAAYLYAVATAKAFQNRGLCRALMADTHALLTDLGCAGAVLVPGSSELFGFYEKMGYVTVPCADSFACTAASEPEPLRKIDTAEFVNLRSALLGQNDVIFGVESLRFLSSVWQLYAGKDWLLTAYDNGDRLIGMELLGNTAAAPGILAALGKAEGSFRTPGTAPFAMYRCLTDDAVPSYFGPAFD